jgi:hypothetical protein
MASACLVLPVPRRNSVPPVLPPQHPQAFPPVPHLT